MSSEIHCPEMKKQLWIGSFTTNEEAALAHDVVAYQAKLNFPEYVSSHPFLPPNSSIKDICMVARQAADGYRAAAEGLDIVEMEDSGRSIIQEANSEYLMTTAKDVAEIIPISSVGPSSPQLTSGGLTHVALQEMGDFEAGVFSYQGSDSIIQSIRDCPMYSPLPDYDCSYHEAFGQHTTPMPATQPPFSNEAFTDGVGEPPLQQIMPDVVLITAGLDIGEDGRRGWEYQSHE